MQEQRYRWKLLIGENFRAHFCYLKVEKIFVVNCFSPQNEGKDKVGGLILVSLKSLYQFSY